MLALTRHIILADMQIVFDPYQNCHASAADIAVINRCNSEDTFQPFRK